MDVIPLVEFDGMGLIDNDFVIFFSTEGNILNPTGPIPNDGEAISLRIFAVPIGEERLGVFFDF